MYGRINLIDVIALSETSVEKALGVLVSNDLKWNKQCSAAAAKANKILGQIKISFEYLDQETLKLLYTSLVRPQLEYAVSAWCPSTKTGIKILERVQRRATKLIKSLRNKPYENRLEERRTRGDLIQIFKILNGFEKIDLVNGVNFAKSLTLNLRRKNNMRLTRELVKRGSHRHNFLTNRVVAKWNCLSQDTVSAKSTNSFKSEIDHEMFGIVQKKRRKSVMAPQGLNAERR